jgi:hypothetical protein
LLLVTSFQLHLSNMIVDQLWFFNWESRHESWFFSLRVQQTYLVIEDGGVWFFWLLLGTKTDRVVCILFL